MSVRDSRGVNITPKLPWKTGILLVEIIRNLYVFVLQK